MPFAIRYFLFLAVAASLMAAPETAHARYNPRWNWRTVKTDHFLISYPEGHEAFARRVIDLSPEVYRDITGYLGVHPERLPVVLNPGTDIFNGFYAPLPNRISLFETPMATLRGFGSSTEDLVDLVYTHEYTHYVHITTRSGSYRLMTTLFGQGFGLLNALSPGWWIEGVTTNTETVFTSGGRGRSPEFKGEMRSFTADGDLWGLSAAGTFPYYRPPGGRFYLAGYHLVDFLHRRHGPDTFARLSRSQGRHPLLMASGAFRRVTGESPGAFYRAFLKDYRARTDSIEAAVRETGLPSGTVLLDEDIEGFDSHFWTPEGRIRSLRTGYGEHNALVEADPSKGKVVRQYRTGNLLALGRARPLPDGRIVYGQPFMHPLAETDLDTADLVALDPVTGKRTRLTRGAHAYSPAVSPDGRTIACTARNGMWMDLLLVDASGGGIRPLSSHPGLYWDAPTWSPDGSVVVAAFKEGGRNGIALVRVADGSMRTFFPPDEHGYNEPSFSPDGRWVVFCSDRSGIWNVYARELGTGRTFRLTAVRFDSEEPLVSPDGGVLSFLSLTRGLKEVRTMPFRPEAGAEEAFGPEAPFVPAETVLASVPIPESRGVPLRAYAPYFHLPLLGVDEDGATAGLMLTGGDPVGLNVYDATLYYGFSSGRPGYDVRLINRSFWPEIGLRAYDTSLEGNTVGGGNDAWYRERGGEASLGLNIIHRISPSVIASSIRTGTRLRVFDGLEGITISPDADRSVALFGEFALARTPEAPTRDMVPGWGQSFLLEAEGSLEALGSELPGHNLATRFTQYIPSPLRHHGFALSLLHQNRSGRLRYSTAGYTPLGYDDDDPEGGFNLDNTLAVSLDYRFPLWFADRGLGMTLAHLHLLHGSLFVDHGAGWSGSFDTETWERNARTSFGFTLRAGTTLLYIAPVDFGVAVGYKPSEEEVFARALFGVPIETSIGARGRGGVREYLRGLRWR